MPKKKPDMRNEHTEWLVDCSQCGDFIHHQKGEPTVCPKCGEEDIDTKPID